MHADADVSKGTTTSYFKLPTNPPPAKRENLLYAVACDGSASQQFTFTGATGTTAGTITTGPMDGTDDTSARCVDVGHGALGVR